VIARYFLRLAEEFEVLMQIYRQQILEMEHHLASADQSAALKPQGCCWSLKIVSYVMFARCRCQPVDLQALLQMLLNVY